MKRAAKGSSGYIRYEKVKRGLITLVMFAIPLTMFFTGLIMSGTRKNLLTVVAILGILPAAKSAVSWIMILIQKSAPQQLVEKTEEAAPDLVRAYELTVTAYEGRMPLDAVVIRNGSVVCISLNGKKEQFAFMEKHMQTILAQNGHHKVKVKIFSDEKTFLDRVKDMEHVRKEERNSTSSDADSANQNADRNADRNANQNADRNANQNDDRNADQNADRNGDQEQTGLTRDEKILAVIKAISL